MSFILQRVGGGPQITSLTEPKFDGQQHAWRYTDSAGQAAAIVGEEADFTVSGGPQQYPDLSQNAFIGLALAVGALTAAKLVAISKDATDNVAAFWIRFRAAISISHPDNTTPAGMATRDGLAALVASAYLSGTYLTQAESDAIVANWPAA